MDYLNVVLKGYFNERDDLKAYFNEEQYKAKNEGITPERFKRGCLKIINGLKSRINWLHLSITDSKKLEEQLKADSVDTSSIVLLFGPKSKFRGNLYYKDLLLLEAAFEEPQRVKSA